MKPVLHGVRVLDLTHVLAGPFAGYQLAVMGAEVIKIESPEEPDQARYQGSDAALLPMVPAERRAELDRRFRAALALKDVDVDDVAAGRRYLAAYVSFFKYAEGEEHEHHGHEHEHAHELSHAH